MLAAELAVFGFSSAVPIPGCEREDIMLRGRDPEGPMPVAERPSRLALAEGIGGGEGKFLIWLLA